MMLKVRGTDSWLKFVGDDGRRNVQIMGGIIELLIA